MKSESSMTNEGSPPTTEMTSDDGNVKTDADHSFHNGQQATDDSAIVDDGNLPEHDVPSDFEIYVHDDGDDNGGTAPPSPGGQDDGKKPLAEAPTASPPLQSIPPESDHEPSQTSNTTQQQRRKRGRSRIATIASASKAKGLPLPFNQYECRLVRRAVKPLDPDKPVVPEEEDIYGDIALGMKLTVAETGQVIVQTVTSLSDGRASPAQLTGKIKRGDILLFIDGISLGENALLALNRLKAPVDKNVPCQREYLLRFAAGEGSAMLENIEQKQTAKKRAVQHDPASEMLGLFPMVDQLSGMPLFEEPTKDVPLTTIETRVASETSLAKENIDVSSETIAVQQTLDERISDSLAKDRITDRNIYLMEWLRNNPELDINAGTYVFEKGFSPETVLTVVERQDLGRKAVSGITKLLKLVEDIDAGNDTRSFQSWNTTLSLYSRASTRRKRVFDAASLPAHFTRVQEEQKEEDESDVACGGSVDSQNSDQQSEQLDGDELLLRLAARDEIWRKQVLEFLEKVGKEDPDATEEEEDKEEEQTEEPGTKDMDTALSNELGNFLFGANMTKILAKNKTPRALPSEEITAVLFDLATRLSATVPDEIKASGSFVGSRSGLTPFEASSRRQSVGDDFDRATRFLLDEALPAWLASFKPLAWEHRRILWPTDRAQTGGSTTASTLSDDSLTVDSGGLSLQTSRSRKRRSIREIIEDNELNPETRGETCFLTSFYFVHALMPKLLAEKETEISNNEDAKTKIKDFLEKYGSYLRMNTCLAYAAAVRAEDVIDLLLGIAKYDPRHREVIKQTSKQATMVFYEPTMLSAVLQLLHDIHTTTDDRRLAIIDLCVSAYPDLRPWQVEKACRAVASPTSSKNVAATSVSGEGLYYRYMSLLLHPTDGHGPARKNAALVKEWCTLSVNGVLRNEDASSTKVFRSNFLSVASRASSHHLVYHRDLSILLDLSMQIKEHSLALDLIGEILVNERLCKDAKQLELVRDQLRVVGRNALNSKIAAPKILRRILRLYGRPSFRKAYHVHDELLELLEYVSSNKADSKTAQSVQPQGFVQFLCEEAQPSELLTALAKHNTSSEYRSEAIPILHTILSRGISDATELSSSLLHIQQARQRIKDLRAPMVLSEGTLSVDSDHSVKQSIWTNASIGMVEVEK